MRATSVSDSWLMLQSLKFVVDVAQPPSQVQDRVMLARQQSVDAQPGLRGEILEAAPFDLVGDEDLALLLRQLVEGGRELLQQHAARELRLRPALRRGEKVREREGFALDRDAVVGRFRPPLAEEIDD